MALEDLTGAGKFISALNPAWPTDADFIDEGDNHVRGIKNVLRNTFPNLDGAVSATDEDLSAIAGMGLNAMPAGAILDFAGAAAPGGWLLCDGASYTTAAQPRLFAVIGYTYGGSGGNFSVPDLRGRVAAGRDNMGGTAANRLTTAGSGVDGAVLGAGGGAQSVAITVPQMPAHGHSLQTGAQNVNHTHTGTTGNESQPHAHNPFYSANGAFWLNTYAAGAGGNPLWASLAPGATPIGYEGSTLPNTVSHTHNFTSGNESVQHVHAIASEGGGGAHPNAQPSLVLNKIIRA